MVMPLPTFCIHLELYSSRNEHLLFKTEAKALLFVLFRRQRDDREGIG